MTTAQVTKLEIQVIGLNSMNGYIQELLAEDKPALTKFIDKKIFKADESKTKLFGEYLPYTVAAEKRDGMHIRRSHMYKVSGGALGFEANVCISYDGNAYYFNKWVAIGAMDESRQILKSIYTLAEIAANRPDIWDNYNREVLQMLIAAYEQKKEEARELFSKIPTCVKEAFHLSN